MRYKHGGLQKGHYNKDEVMRHDCPLCNSASCVTIYRERGELGIVRCQKCSLIYTNPMVKEPEKTYWGDGDEYLEEARLIFEDNAGHHRDPNYLEDLKRIEAIKPRGSFLDIGTNMGFFLRHTRGRDWNVFGVEPSPSLSKIARECFGLNVRQGFLHEIGFKENFFDVCTMTDVFEHISKPKNLLREIRRVLKKDGILFIKVPNGKYSLLKLKLGRLLGKCGDYDLFDSYEHIVHYTDTTLKRMLEDSGFKIKNSYIGRPIQLPVWHRYVGRFYQYPSPWALDVKNRILRVLFYWISKLEFLLRFGKFGYFAPNIIVIAEKDES